ncbi:MAG: SpoIIE family protein phosphatase, partial [Candidatus Omnitrophica bacterium]|nr:SpoIIE family protein phosphatase [Candidatus Omnitrophota bacterium]
KEIPMEKGDILFLYTDGISESMNTRRKEFGIERVKNILTAGYELKAKDIMMKVLAEIAKFSKGAPQHDDMTVIVIKVI